MATGLDIAKAGWLHRESSVLHRWKKSWFVLDRIGDLRHFETPDHHVAEERIVVRAQVRRIRTGLDCGSVSLPDKMSKSAVLVLDMNDGDCLTLCAENQDDMRAWQMAIEEAQTANRGQPTVNVIKGNVSYQQVGQPLNSTTTVIGGTGYYPGGASYYSGYSGYQGYPGHQGYPGQVISTPGLITTTPGVTVLPQGQVIPGNSGTTYIAAPQQQVVYMNSPRYYRHGLLGSYLW